jgi:hypothetical protein
VQLLNVGYTFTVFGKEGRQTSRLSYEKEEKGQTKRLPSLSRSLPLFKGLQTGRPAGAFRDHPIKKLDRRVIVKIFC